MRMTRLLSTTALIMTLAVSGVAYAQDAGGPPPGGLGGHPGWEKMHEHREELLAQLPPEKAKLFKDTMKSVHEKNKATFDQIKKLHQEQDAILTADKFDKTAYLAKESQIDKLFEQTRATHREAFVTVASQFTADERKVLAKMYSHMMHDHGMMPPPPMGKETDHSAPSK